MSQVIGRFSRLQRIVLAAYATFVIGAVFLHYPFGQYSNTKVVVVKRGHGNCPAPTSSVQEAINLTKEQLDRIYEQARGCTDEWEERLLSPLAWQSHEPLVAWFGPLSHVLSLVAVTTLVALLWFWSLRSPHTPMR